MKHVFEDLSKKLVLEDDGPVFIAEDLSNKLVFEDDSPVLIFEDLSKKLVFDIPVITEVEGIFDVTFDSTFE